MFQLRSLPKQGFTMIEMATTLVVAGIITTVGIVAVAPAVEHAKVRSAANVVAGDLQYAQALAVRERRPISVVVDSASMQLVIRDRDLVAKVYRTIRLLRSGADAGGVVGCDLCSNGGLGHSDGSRGRRPDRRCWGQLPRPAG